MLDEHMSPKVAAKLRETGVDAYSIAGPEYFDIQGAADKAVLERAVQERRVIVTYNYADYTMLHRDYLLQGWSHFGIVLVPRGKIRSNDMGAQIKALSQLVNERESLTDQLMWLEPA